MISALDQAYVAVMDSDEPNEELEFDYYDLFLNSVLYVPTHEVPDEELKGVSNDEIAVLPVVIEDGDRQYIMLFDDKAQLQKWAGDEDFGVAEMQGYDVINIFGADSYMMLNVLSENQKEFTPEEIEFLLSNIKEVKQKA